MKPNWEQMDREQAIVLLKDIRNSLIGCEDAGDAVLYISEKLGVDQRAGAQNEFEE